MIIRSSDRATEFGLSPSKWRALSETRAPFRFSLNPNPMRRLAADLSSSIPALAFPRRLHTLGFRMKRIVPMLAAAVCATLLCAPSASAIVLGQVDNFQNGTTMGWANGVPGHLVNLDGGPNGPGDRFLQLTSDGVGQGGRLTALNLQQWLGNYIAQGVTAIELDLRNQGQTQLSIRLAFKSANTTNAPGYLSQAIILAPGSSWQRFSISLTAANLIRVGNAADYNTFFSTGVADVRIMNAVGTANLNGDFIVGQLGIDNIRAVPEPSAIPLIAGGVILLVFHVCARGATSSRSHRGTREGARPFPPSRRPCSRGEMFCL